MVLYQGDGALADLSNFTDAGNTSDPNLAFLQYADNEDIPAVAGPFGDPRISGFVVPTTGTYTLLVCSACSSGGAGSYGYLLDIRSRPTIRIVEQNTFFGSVQSAVDAAEPGQTVELGCGLITESDVAAQKGLTIRGAGMELTVIDPGGAGSGIQILNPESFAGAPAVLTDMTIRNCVDGGLASAAGATLASAGGVEVRRVRFEHNDGGNLIGGLYCLALNATITVDRCEFIGNVGGGVSVGGVFCGGDSGYARVLNSLFVGNEGFLGPGAIQIATGNNGDFIERADVVNCTFVGHPSSGFPSQALIDINSFGSGSITNCVFGENDNNELSGVAASPSEILVRYSVLGPGTVLAGDVTQGPGNSATAPAFEDGPNGDYRLRVDSVGIDAGDMQLYLEACGGALDLSGNARFNDDPQVTNTGTLGSALDAGAYEWQTDVANIAACEGDANGDGVVDVNDISFVLFRLGNPCP